MKDKKHIDRLFQEKLKDFEVTPNDAIWESIERELHQKKRKRRVIPLWWRIAGVAAILALLFTAGNLVFNHNLERQTTTRPVVDTNDKGNTSDKSQKENTISNNAQDENVAVENPDETPFDSNSESDGVANQPQNHTPTIANTSRESSNGANAQNANVLSNQTSNNSNNTVTVASNTNEEDGTNVSNLPEPNPNQTDIIQNKPELDALIKDNKKNAVTDVPAKDDTSETNKETPEKEASSLEDAIAMQNDINEKEKEEEKLSRWTISPNVAPVYFNSLGKGSSLDEQFVDNSKSGDINMSYGLNGSYAVNEKLKIRAGINKVALGYTTENVVIYQNSGANIISSVASQARNSGNISYNENSKNTAMLSAQNLSFASAPEIMNTNDKSSLNQEFGFIEVPVEVEYAILSNKLGVNVIGGFSTFFLNNNKVYSSQNGERILLGEANNINNTSYSANFGLGINYNVSNKIKLNLEPTFKYQINTFRDTSGNFQPYFIGVYSGLSFKF